MRLGAGHGISGNAGDGFTTFMVHTFQSGGMGARPDSDGLAATPFPPGVKSVPVEITETITPLVVWRKELRQDSGGAGRQRGGLGQVMEIGNREPYPFGIFARFERVDFPPRGRHGAQDGAAGVISLAKAGSRLRSKGLQVIPKDDRLLVEFPGGGGLGPASERDPERVRADVLNGYVSREQAKAVYKVVLSDELALDEAATASLRSA
jgi:N-methylhydantoinase B